MSKNIFFSLETSIIDFKSIDDKLIISAEFVKNEAISECIEKLNKIGYTILKEVDLKFVKKDSSLFIEGIAYTV